MFKTLNFIQNEKAGSCLACQRLQEDFIYFINYEFHYCSINCLLKYYPNQHLKIMWSIVLPKEPMFATRNNTIFELSKEMRRRGW